MDMPNNKESEILLDAQGEILVNGRTDIKCPRCGGAIEYEEGSCWEITRCEIPDCISITFKGI